jgi:ribose transport system substrate-binding protein
MEESMKRKGLLLVAMMILILMLSPSVFAQSAKPYFQSSDFTAWQNVEKEAVYEPADQMKVKPVNMKSPEPIKIAYIGGVTNPFWDAVYKGYEAARDELAKYNCKLDWVVPGTTLSTSDYGEAIVAVSNQGYKAVCSMVFNDGFHPYIEEAVNSGVPVGAMIGDSEHRGKALFYVGQDSYKGGVIAARALAKAINKKGKVGIITGNIAVLNHELRRQGFLKTIAKEYPGIQVVGTQENHDQADEGFNHTANYLSAHPDLAAIYNTAGGPTGAIEAIKQAGKAGKVKVFCFMVPELVPYIRGGECEGAVAQNAFAEGHDTPIRLFNYLMKGTLPPAYNLYTDLFVVTKESLDKFIASLEGA